MLMAARSWRQSDITPTSAVEVAVSDETVEVLVIGAGQAGIAMSEHLGKQGIGHLVLERDRVAERWRSWRWDSLVANGPAWHDRFPGSEFDCPPEAFAGKEEVADYLAAHAEKVGAPIRTGVEVTKVRKHEGRPGFHVETSDGTIDEFFDDIAGWGVDAVVMEPSCNIRQFLTRHGKHCGAVGGMDCRDLMSKSDAEIEREMRDLMAFGKQYPGFMLAVGNHLPNNVPVDKALLYHRLYEELAAR